MKLSRCAITTFLLLFFSHHFAYSTAPNKPFGMGLNGITYWSDTPFANVAMTAGNWMQYVPPAWGSVVYTWGNPQFDANTNLPRYLNPGTRLRLLLFPMNANYFNRPSSWPARTNIAVGKILVEWTGRADIRLNTGTFVPAESSGPATGSLTDGERMYLTSGSVSMWIEIHSIDPMNPVTSLKVWLPDPSNPTVTTLRGQFFHPTFLERLADFPFSFIRAMDWIHANGSPMQDWSDRRLPSHFNQTGALHPRAPAAGFSGNRVTGVAYEYAVMLANHLHVDLWVTIPHLATDDHIRKLAQLIRFGSDGVNPYTSPHPSPVFPPLHPDLKVYVEFSNEIWSSGNSFPQGNWAQDQAALLGITKAQFNARMFCRTWSIFQDVFGGASRLVRVAALFTANTTYNQQFLTELASYCPTLTPSPVADVASPTTYFGNGIQDWVHQKAIDQADTLDPWFYTTGRFFDFTWRPISLPPADPYWTSSAFSSHLLEAFAEWKRRIYSGSTLSGGGFDATGMGGGFDAGLPQLIEDYYGSPLPLVAYEGGPSIYTDYLDGGDNRDDGITTFIEAMCRHPQIAEIFRTQYNMAWSKGMRKAGIFVGPFGRWNKFGQWGQLEYMDQPPTTSPRWMEHIFLTSDLEQLRPINSPLLTKPQFVTGNKLPSGTYAVPLSHTITWTDGEGTITPTVIGTLLDPGISYTINPTNITISGTPTDGGENYLYARIVDSDGDADWKIYSLYVGGGPNVVLESKFEGVSPALSLPWTSIYQIEPDWLTSGWTRGSGITPTAENDCLAWHQNMPAAEVDSTLAQAISDNEFWQITMSPDTSGLPLDLRQAEVRLSVNRIGFHAARRYALLTSATGFAAHQAVYISPRITQTGSTIELVFKLPGSPLLEHIDSPITFRVVGFSGQFSGHKTRIMKFRVKKSTSPSNDPPTLPTNPLTLSPAIPDTAYLESLAAAYSDPFDTVSWTKISGPSWLSTDTSGNLSGTPTWSDIGLNTFVFRVTDSYGAWADLTVLINVLHPYNNWRASNFTTGELGNPAISGFSADPDGDGVPNLLEYALGGNPKNSLSSATPFVSSVPVGPEERLTLTFTPQTLAGLRYYIEVSNDLVSWTTAADVTALLTSGVPYTFTDAVDLLSAPRRFALLRVELDAPETGISRTIPVGAVEMKIAPGTGGAKVLNALAAPLLSQTIITGRSQGLITGLTTNTLTSVGAGWTPGALATAANPHLVRILTGSAAGHTFLIGANTADTLTLHGTDAALVDLTTLGIITSGPNPDRFQILPCDTLLSLLGTPGTTDVFGGTSAAAADTVAVFSPHLGNHTYFYHTGSGQWVRNSFGFPPANDTPIRPETGLQYQRLKNTAIRQVYLGTVPHTQRRVFVRNSGGTLVSSGWPTNVNLSSSQITTIAGWVSNSSPSVADIVGLGIMNYFHDGTQWRRQSFGNPLANPPIHFSTSILLNKKGTVPGHSVLQQNLPYILP
jgi:hypothetical protein